MGAESSAVVATWMFAASASLGTFLVKRLCSLHFKLVSFWDIFLPGVSTLIRPDGKKK